MPKLRLAAATLLLCLASGALRAEYLGDIYINPLGFALPFDGGAVGFEWAVPYNESLRIQARFNGRRDYPAPADSRTVAGIEAGWRFFLSGPGQLRGFFVGPEIGVGVQNDTYTDAAGHTGTTASGTFYKVGAELGHQWILGPGFVLTPALTADFVPSYSVGTGRQAADARLYGGLELNLGWAIPR